MLEWKSKLCDDFLFRLYESILCPGYERVYLPLYKVADTTFYNQGGIVFEVCGAWFPPEN